MTKGMKEMMLSIGRWKNKKWKVNNNQNITWHIPIMTDHFNIKAVIKNQTENIKHIACGITEILFTD